MGISADFRPAIRRADMASTILRGEKAANEILREHGGTLILPRLADAGAVGPVEARQRLSQLLTAARVAAGKPKLATLARDIGYSESMLSRVMNGKTPAARDKLERLAEELDVENRTFRSVWVPLWEAASRKAEPGPAPAASEPSADPPGAPSGFVCPACGSWVVDAPTHISWHMQMSAAGQEGSGTVTPLRAVP
jgi:transcriptional regulator with XRE-family HTH domain